jgi:hypothetical protein
MPQQLRQGNDTGTRDVLRQWRTRAVTIVILIALAVSLPAFIFTIIPASRQGSWLLVASMCAVYAAMLACTVFRKLDYRLRGSVLLAACCLMGITNLVSYGVYSSGLFFLMVTPILAAILIGPRAGWAATALTALLYGGVFVLNTAGISQPWMLPLPDPGDSSIWLIRGATTLALAVLVVVLLVRMNRFLANIIASERRLSAELEETYDQTLEGWARALELRDIETAGHCHRVYEITRRLSSQAGLCNGDMDDVHRGSLLHDIGKMGIPDCILFKPGKLTDEEFRQMREHTTYAYELLSHIPYLHRALDIPYCHHEKWDGSGYPRGLKGTEIPLSARVFSVVDVYDALVSDRPYREAWPEERALAYIRERAGTEFDPAVVEAFLKLAEEEAVQIDG